MLASIAPDLVILFLGFLIIGLDLFLPKSSSKTILFNLAWVGPLVSILLLLRLPPDLSASYLQHYHLTGQGLVLKILFALALMFTVLLSKTYFEEKGNLRGQLKSPAEFFGILSFCTFGMFTLVSASDFLTFFIGLELATIPLYALTGYYKEEKSSTEAASKYILMGASSTAVFLFGASFLYGAAGSLEFSNLQAYAGQSYLFTTGAIFMVASIGFKMALVPFHMWAPDVYQGAPTPITAFLSVASKTAGLSALIILFYGPLSSMREPLLPLFVVLACLTMVVGNLGALRQLELRRFMGYSSIAQAGYILVGFVGNNSLARSSMVFYLLVYAITNYCTFFIISIIGEKRRESFQSLRGLSKQSPLLAAILSLCMFSLAGIPPLAGFTGKFFLFGSAAQSGHYALVVFAALNSTVSLYYYLIVLKEAYINSPGEEILPDLQISFVQRWALLILTLSMVLFGLIPQISGKIAAIF